MSVNFYIYYRVSAQAAVKLREQVLAMQVTLTNLTGIKGQLQEKVDEPLLWMEVYEDVKDRAAFERALQHLLTTTNLPISARKTEIFSPVE